MGSQGKWIEDDRDSLVASLIINYGTAQQR